MQSTNASLRWRRIPPKQLNSAAERLHLLHCIKGWSSDCPLIFENGDLYNRFAVREHKIVPEIVLDDQSLILQTERCILIILGCAHSDMFNVINYAIKMVGVDEIFGVADIFYPLNPFDTIKSDIKYPPLSVESAIHIISTL